MMSSAQAQTCAAARWTSPAPEYPGASRFAPAHRVELSRGQGARAIDEVVIHITDGGSRITGTIGWFQNPDQRNARQPADPCQRRITWSGATAKWCRWCATTTSPGTPTPANGHSIGIEHVANTRGLTLRMTNIAARLRWWRGCATATACRSTARISSATPKPIRHTTHTDCPNAVWDWAQDMACVRDAAAGGARRAKPWARWTDGHARAQEIITPFYDPADPASALTCQADAFSQAREEWFAGVPNTGIFPHSAICLLEIKDSSGAVSSYGTGFYIGPNRILTCGHNLRNAASVDVIPACNDTVEPYGRFNVTPANWRKSSGRYDGGGGLTILPSSTTFPSLRLTAPGLTSWRS